MAGQWFLDPGGRQPDVGGQAAGEAELGLAGDDQPGPPVRGGRVSELGPSPAQDLLKNLNVCSTSKRRRNAEHCCRLRRR